MGFIIGEFACSSTLSACALFKLRLSKYQQVLDINAIVDLGISFINQQRPSAYVSIFVYRSVRFTRIKYKLNTRTTMPPLRTVTDDHGRTNQRTDIPSYIKMRERI